MAHVHNVYDTDTYFSIDPVTRVIKNQSSKKTTLMQNDHNSERFTFELPRFIEGHDMSLCNEAEVHYLNISAADKKEQRKGLYNMKDLQISPDDTEKVRCSWLISKNATQLVGALTFRLRFKCVEDGVINYAWHTAIHTGVSVSDGINADETFEMDYVDIIERWKEAIALEIANDVNADVSAWKEVESGKVRGEMTSFSAQWNELLNVERKRIDQFVAMPEGATTNDAELLDSRIGYDGKTYPTSGSAVREQSKEIIDNLINAGVYAETVLIGTDKQGAYIARNEGVIAEVERASRGYVTFDVREYVGKTLLISTIIDSDAFSTVVFADANNNPIETTPGFTTYYKVLRIVPNDASIMYVNYSIAEVANNNVSVKVVDVLDVADELKNIHIDIQRSDKQMNTFARDGKLPVLLSWEYGWIDYSSGKDSAAIYTERMKTAGYYKPMFSEIHYSIPEGYRFLALRYNYDADTGAYTFVNSTGYINGNKSGEITVNEGDCFRFLFRGNPDVDLLENEYENLTLYCKSEKIITTDTIDGILDNYEKDPIPDYWAETIKDKETEIKNIVMEATKADNDIAMFFAIADPHYPANTGVSTALIKYLGRRCGIGLTVCLGDLIMDSTESHEEGLQRIQAGIVNLENMSDRMILTQGNHDTNVQISDSNGQLLAERIIFDKEWILHTNNKLLNLNNVVFDDLRKAFYYDDDLQKIRFISLDSFEGKAYTITDGVLTGLSLGTMTDRQIKWLESVLSSVPAGYSAITFSHYGLYKPYIYNESENKYVSITMGGIGNSDDVMTAIRKFVNSGGVFIGHFGGHLHHDFVCEKSGLISAQLLNDGMDWRKASYFGEGFEFVGDSPVKTEGTTTECAFDVVIINKTTQHVDLIRVGAGENRKFDY